MELEKLEDLVALSHPSCGPSLFLSDPAGVAGVLQLQDLDRTDELGVHSDEVLGR